MSKFQIIGLLIIFIGVAMFFFGVSMFTYQGKALNPIISKLGMYSFLYWLPTIIVGGAFMFIRKDKKKV